MEFRVAPSRKPIAKIVSGGQTGADRAALDWAIARGLPHGGWCPKDRRAEDGPLAACYRLEETPSRRYAERTRLNVRDSDGTLIVTLGPLGGGSLLTQQIARALAKPCLTVPLDEGVRPPLLADIRAWLGAHRIRRLNVAGPRESKCPGIGRVTRELLDRLMP
jgi:hypothetical protein